MIYGNAGNAVPTPGIEKGTSLSDRLSDLGRLILDCHSLAEAMEDKLSGPLPKAVQANVGQSAPVSLDELSRNVADGLGALRDRLMRLNGRL